MWPFKKTKEEWECIIAKKEKELEILWKFEERGRYAIGCRADIISLEAKIA